MDKTYEDTKRSQGPWAAGWEVFEAAARFSVIVPLSLIRATGQPIFGNQQPQTGHTPCSQSSSSSTPQDGPSLIS